MFADIEDLQLFPHVGQSIEGLPKHYREWLIDFASSGYITRYHVSDEQVVMLSFAIKERLHFDSVIQTTWVGVRID